MAEFLSIGAAAFLLGVAVSTLRRWEKESRFFSDFRTPGGHRRYALDKLLAFCGQSTANEQRRTICYVLALMTVFSARLHGSRSRKNQRAIA